ncbi:MAG: tetratricopeptide repeat protein, partial [Flavobacteriales bacterium]|nr:tetratricopeptide repeat protein [Flavobacteriales bacterium]
AKLDDFNGSITDFDLAIELDAKFSDAYFNRGLSYFKLKNYKASAADFTKVISFNGKDFEAYFARGNANFSAGKNSAACKDWSKSAELGYFDAYEVIKMKCN